MSDISHQFKGSHPRMQDSRAYEDTISTQWHTS